MIIPAANRLNGIGEYYFSAKLREVRQLAARGEQIINLGIGNPDLPPSVQTIEALSNEAARQNSHGYQPYRGIDELRAAMAGYYQKHYAVILNPDTEVLPLIGSKEGIFQISMAFLNPGDQVLIPDPGYPGYAAAARLAAAEPVSYDLTKANHWLPDPEFLKRIDCSRVKILWVNYPHMPTGAIATAEDFRRLIGFAREHQILICHDNPYSMILNPSRPLSILEAEGAFECCLELNSLSKSHNMAGWRIGMAAGKQTYLESILRVKSNIDSGMFRPVQTAAVQALQNSAGWHRAQNRIYQRRRELIYRFLDHLELQYETGTAGMFVWAKAPDYIVDVEAYLDDLLYSKGIFLTPGKVFGKNGLRYIRVSLCVSEKMIQEALNRVQTHEKVQQ